MYRQRIVYFSLNCLYFSKVKRESETSNGIEVFDLVVQQKTLVLETENRPAVKSLHIFVFPESRPVDRFYNKGNHIKDLVSPLSQQ